jgi:hypothetical protein
MVAKTQQNWPIYGVYNPYIINKSKNKTINAIFNDKIGY